MTSHMFRSLEILIALVNPYWLVHGNDEKIHMASSDNNELTQDTPVSTEAS